MKKLIILLTLALSFSFADAKKYSGLKAKDYKNVEFVIEKIHDDSNTGLTNQEIQSKVKITLLRNGFKIVDKPSGDYIYINLNLLDIRDKIHDVYNIDIIYKKISYNHFSSLAEIKSAGVTFVPDQGTYSSLGITSNKSDITNTLQRLLEELLVDYIESNIE